MHFKPIKTATDHEAALSEIESLMDAADGSPDGDRLEVLVTLVDAWEALHHPIENPDPSKPSSIAWKHSASSGRTSSR